MAKVVLEIFLKKEKKKESMEEMAIKIFCTKSQKMSHMEKLKFVEIDKDKRNFHTSEDPINMNGVNI